MTLQNNSIIVSLSVSQWAARKLDKKITDEVNEQHNASHDAGRYNKLLVDKKFTEPIQRMAGKARQFHYDNTLCWGDNNERLLPAENYFDYVNTMNKLKSDFQQAVNDFLKNYDEVITDAKRRLNGMYNDKDYPSRLEIESKFGFKTTFMPVPDTDIKIAMLKGEVDKIKMDIENELTNRLTEAVAGIWERIHEQLKSMKEKFADEKAIFRDSLFGNLQELIELLPKLNVTKDVNIARICNEMSKLVTSPDLVRNNPSIRTEKFNQVNDILNKFGGFFDK